MTNIYLENTRHLFLYYKTVGERTFAQVNDEQLFWISSFENNSIAMIIQHLSGNMLSRWTDFLTTDGEKPNRDRDKEFEGNQTLDRTVLLEKWNKGWDCLFSTLQSLTDEDLYKTITIRGENQYVIEAINRQIGHYCYHVGQIVTLAKIQVGDNWTSLTIPKGTSQAFNDSKRK